MKRVKPTVCDCGHAGLHVNDYGCIQWLRSELKAANRKIAKREEQDRLHAIEVERIAAEVTAECRDEIASEKQLELQITALEERLRVAVYALTQIETMVINSPRDFEMRAIARDALSALAKLKPTSEKKS